MRTTLIVSIILVCSSVISNAQEVAKAPSFEEYAVAWKNAPLSAIVTDLRADLKVKIAFVGDWSESFDIAIAGFDKNDPESVIAFIGNQAGATLEMQDDVYVLSKRATPISQLRASKAYAVAPDEKDAYNRWFKDIYVRPFHPKARYYFDSGTDDPNEIDIFQDGGMTPVIDFINIYYPLNISKNRNIGRFMGDDWLLGPSVGIGITTPADPDGDMESSSAPVLLVSGALELDIPVGKQKLGEQEGEPNYISLEFGWTKGWSTDEDIENNDDSALFVGLGYSWKQDKFKGPNN